MFATTHAAALVFVALITGAAATASGPEFDYFLFVRQWPGTVCGSKAYRPCRVPPEHNVFTIHGLWPQYVSGGWPEDCTPDDFDPNTLTNLLPKLRFEWPSYYGANNAFWDHEWSKHGTCAKSVLADQVTYFQTVLSLNEKYNLTNALLDDDITPGSDDSVQTAEVAQAIQAETGAQPLIHCSAGEVYEVWMCVDKSLKAFNCPEATVAAAAAAAASRENGSCGKYVKLPSIKAKQQTYRRLRA